MTKKMGESEVPLLEKAWGEEDLCLGGEEQNVKGRKLVLKANWWLLDNLVRENYLLEGIKFIIYVWGTNFIYYLWEGNIIYITNMSLRLTCQWGIYWVKLLGWPGLGLVQVEGKKIRVE